MRVKRWLGLICEMIIKLRSITFSTKQSESDRHQGRFVAKYELIQQMKWPSGERRMVEFLGGPLDGHVEWIDANEVHPHSPRVSFAIGPSTFPFLDGDRPTFGATTTSLAVYELWLEDGRWLYRFIRQAANRDSYHGKGI